jgi:amidase
VLQQQRLDALVWPTSGPAWKVELGAGDFFNSVGTTSPPAVAGYPHVTVPAGFDGPLPLGFSIVGPAGSDARMLAYAHAFERTIEARRPPRFLAG